MARVLTWDEVRELRTGDKVLVEHAPDQPFYDSVHRVERDDAADDVMLVDRQGEKWHVMPEWKDAYNRIYRVWEKPTMPTDGERAAAPKWGTEVEG